MKFRYKRYDIDTLRPVIEIIVKSDIEKLPYYVLVDSGADFCLFHAEIAEALGISVDTGEVGVVKGIDGECSSYYLHKVKIDVGGCEKEIEVGFLPTIAGKTFPYGVVGQKGFFEHFLVSFNLLKQEIELQPTFFIA